MFTEMIVPVTELKVGDELIHCRYKWDGVEDLEFFTPWVHKGVTPVVSPKHENDDVNYSLEYLQNTYKNCHFNVRRRVGDEPEYRFVKGQGWVAYV